MRGRTLIALSFLAYSYLACARPQSCVELFSGETHFAVSRSSSDLRWLKAEFNRSKTSWFLAPELRGPQPSERLLDQRMEQVFAFEKIRIQNMIVEDRLSRMGESGGQVTGFKKVSDTSRYSYAEPPWTQTATKVYEFEPNSTPQEDGTLGDWKGRVYLAAGNLILREPKMAEENVDAKVFFFEEGELKQVLSFSEFVIERLPEDFVTIYRAMSKDEEALWRRSDIAGLLREGQKRIEVGTAHSRFKRPGFYFSVMAPAPEFNPSGELISVRISKSRLLEMARKQQLFVGTHKALNEIFFLPEAFQTLARSI